MAPRLPPLTSVKAFEAAARHGSFKLAAAELHVTPAAVSLQVKQLEEWLGLSLFDRSGASIALTGKGRAYCQELSTILAMLGRATEAVRGDGLSGSLRITALPSFAAKWLLPRLGGFTERYPDIDMVLDTDAAVQNLAGGKFDLAIRGGTGRWQGLAADLIAAESFTPLCSPAYMASAAALAAPSDLARHPLIHSTPRDGWERWLTAARVDSVDSARGLVVSDSGMALQAAIDGRGIVMGRTCLAGADIAAGRLVAPFALEIPNDFSYWLVYPKTSAGLANIAAFRDWILGEAAA
jgi:LysR family glycine cleavage system transcriptional activator